MDKEAQKFIIKNMVCNRCIAAVRDIFSEIGLPVEHIQLGEVKSTSRMVSEEERGELREQLQKAGFELLDDEQSQMIEKIKGLVIQTIHHKGQVKLQQSWSNYISKELGQNYSSLSKAFSAVEGITLEQYIIHQRIEKAKELIFYKEMNLSQIAHHLDYSSVAHFSAQFKKITGMSPKEFQKNASSSSKRQNLDQV